jgi:hypothetical protein
MHMTCLHTRSTSGSTTSSTAANLLLQLASSSSFGGLSGTFSTYKDPLFPDSFQHKKTGPQK